MEPTDSRDDRARAGPSRIKGSFWDRQLRARIGQDLRALLSDADEEPLPDHLNRILLRMEAAAEQSSQASHPPREDSREP